MGKVIAPIFSPLGLGQWQVAVALVFGFLAKEVVVGTMGVLFIGAEELGGLGSVIGFELGWTPLIAFTLMVFTLISLPCVAALGAVKEETNSWKWTIFTAVYLTGLAWIICFLIYQIGKLFV